MHEAIIKAVKIASDRWAVSVLLPDGSQHILSPDDARELGNRIRGKAAECEVMAARLNY